MPPFSYLGSIMRLLVAILCLLSASASFAAGITSKTADFVIYKNSLGSSTIPIPNWELVIDGDSLAGKKNLPVPKSSSSFNVKLPLPRAKLLPSLAKFAKLNPYLFIAQGLIDLYFDETKQEFMIESNPAVDCNSEVDRLLRQCPPFRDAIVHQIILYSDSVALVSFSTPDGSSANRYVRIINPYPNEFYVEIEPYCYSIPYNSPTFCGSNSQPQTKPATETDIAQNLDKNLTMDKLPAVRDLVTSQGWTLETDTTPAVSGPPEVVISTQRKTVQNPDGTTTEQTIVEKNVYTYNNNVITENHVTQIFYGDQLVENNVTEVNNETSNEPVDYTFQPPSGEYPTDLEIPEKRDLVAEVLNPVASQLEGFGSKIGLRGSGQCSFDIPFSLGRASGSGRLDFCQYQSTFSTVGSMLVAFAYLMAGLIVLGMRH